MFIGIIWFLWIFLNKSLCPSFSQSVSTAMEIYVFLTKPILFRICITFEKCDSSYVIFFFPEKGKGGRKSLQKRWGKPPFLPSLFSSPLPFFGKEKYDVTGVVFLKKLYKIWKDWVVSKLGYELTSMQILKIIKIIWTVRLAKYEIA